MRHPRLVPGKGSKSRKIEKANLALPFHADHPQWHSCPSAGKMTWMERVVAKFRTFEEARHATLAYYRRLSPAERLEILFALRDMARKEDDATSQRLARVYRIAELKRG
jgi:hypothetical protein